MAGFALWRKTWLLFDPSALGGGGALRRDAVGLGVPYFTLNLCRLNNPCLCKTQTLSKWDYCLKLHNIWRSSSRVGTRLILFSPIKQWELSSQWCGWAILSAFGAIKATCLKCSPFKCQMWEELGREKTIKVNNLKSDLCNIAWIFNIKCIIYYKV